MTEAMPSHFDFEVYAPCGYKNNVGAYEWQQVLMGWIDRGRYVFIVLGSGGIRKFKADHPQIREAQS